MRALIPLSVLVLCAPAGPEDDALRRETAYNSLHRFMLPRLPRGSVCDVEEFRDPSGTAHVSCFLEFAADLDAPRGATVRAGFLRELESAGIDPAKLEPTPVRLPEAMAKAVWPPHYEKEARERYDRLRRSLGVEAPDLRVGASIDVTFGGREWRLSRAPGAANWRFVMP